MMMKITGDDSFVNVSVRFNMEDSGSGIENIQVTYIGQHVRE